MSYPENFIDYDHPLPAWEEEKSHHFPATRGAYTIVSWDTRFAKIIAAHKRILDDSRRIYDLLRRDLGAACTENGVDEETCRLAEKVLYSAYKRVGRISQYDHSTRRALVEYSIYEAHRLRGKHYKIKGGMKTLGRLFRRRVYVVHSYEETLSRNMAHLVSSLGLPPVVEKLAYEIARKIMMRRRERFSPSTMAATSVFIAAHLYGHQVSKTRVAAALGITYMNITNALKKNNIVIEIRDGGDTRTIVLGKDSYAPPTPRGPVIARVVGERVVVKCIRNR